MNVDTGEFRALTGEVERMAETLDSVVSKLDGLILQELFIDGLIEVVRQLGREEILGGKRVRGERRKPGLRGYLKPRSPGNLRAVDSGGGS